jgi:hypothetical protein
MLDVFCASPRNDAERKMVGWIRDVLAPRIVKWMQADVSEDGSLATSLKLVNVPRYYDVYDGLKRKYAGPLKKVSLKASIVIQQSILRDPDPLHISLQVTQLCFYVLKSVKSSLKSVSLNTSFVIRQSILQILSTDSTLTSSDTIVFLLRSAVDGSKRGKRHPRRDRYRVLPRVRLGEASTWPPPLVC